MIYLDQSATSLHKPPQVVKAMQDALTGGLGNPARGAHTAAHAALKALATARRTVAAYFGAEPLDVAFASNATLALNMAIKGVLGPDDRVLTTCLEHNSMLRPLYQLQDSGMALDVLPLNEKGAWSVDDFRVALRPDTTAVAINAMSNVTGQTAPLAEIANLCYQRGLLLILDLSQWAGTRALPTLPRWPRTLMAFTGHKSLYGPQGSGGLVKRGEITLRPLIAGGSGVHSFARAHPADFPEVCEAGTVGLPAILGLAAGVNWLMSKGQEQVTGRLSMLRQRFVEGAARIPGIHLYDGGLDAGPVVALNLGERDSAAVSQALDERFGIATRPGAHCAPLWHRAMGTVDKGAVRFSFSYFNTEQEIDAAHHALAVLARE